MSFSSDALEPSPVLAVWRVVGKPRGGPSQDLTRPGWEIWVNSIMDPEPVATIGDQADLAQLREVTRDVRLCGADRIGQFADAQLSAAIQQYQTAQPGLMGEGRKQLDGVNLHDRHYRSGSERLQSVAVGSGSVSVSAAPPDDAGDGFGRQWILGPVVLRVAAAQLLSHLRVGARPEPGQILSHLHWAARRR